MFEGVEVRLKLGDPVEITDGEVVGLLEGEPEGDLDGTEGDFVGFFEGGFVGEEDAAVGEDVGDCEGSY